MRITRRTALKWPAFAALSGGFGCGRESESAPSGDLPAPIAALEPATAGVEPIKLAERRARLARARQLLVEHDLDAFVMASGSTLAYFTGASWGLSERFFGAVVTREGDPAWVTPAFEELRARQQIQVGDDVRAWHEDESPYELVAKILADRGAARRVGIEETMPFAFSDGIARALPGSMIASATPVTAGCRMIKDAHELSLMRRACEITVRAHRAVFQSLREGMTQSEVARLCEKAHQQQGVRGYALVLFGADAAYPHGTADPQPLKRGEVVLLDGGCTLHGYTSDISRTMVFGAEPTERQRRIWNTVRSAQEAAFAAARPGAECQAVDRAAREVIAAAGFGSDYSTFTHRLGHGIGLDGHEWTYLVRGNAARLRPGMCFSNEPGIYVKGEIGVRLEDIIAITDTGCENLTRWSGTPEDPAVL